MKFETLEKVLSNAKGVKFSSKTKKITTDEDTVLSVFVGNGSQMTRISKVHSGEFVDDVLSFIAGEKEEQYFVELEQVGLISIKKKNKEEDSRPGFV